MSGGRPKGTIESRGGLLCELAKGRRPGVEKGRSDSYMSTQHRTLAKLEGNQNLIAICTFVNFQNKSTDSYVSREQSDHGVWTKGSL